MANTSVEFSVAGIGSTLFTDYYAGKANVEGIREVLPTLAGIKAAMEKRKENPVDREALVSALFNQYEAYGLKSETALAQIGKLSSSDTFTVITGHQPCLLTGPVYFIYKILSAISLCERLGREFPGSAFVPVYWMNSEDHDFEEINHFYLFGKKWEWEKPVAKDAATGSMPPQGIVPVLENLQPYFENQPEITQFLGEAIHIYGSASTYAEATARLVDKLFGEKGLVIFDQQNPVLKKTFWERYGEDLLSEKSVKAVTQTSEILEAAGYELQVNPREINLFYHGENGRKRIVKAGEKYTVLEHDYSWNIDEIRNLMNSSPEKFSTNVITRPLYQETVFPNIAYIGGPAEVHYWLQLTGEFEAFGIPFPAVLMRDSFVLLKSQVLQKIEALGLSVEELFGEEEALIKALVLRQSGGLIHLDEEIQSLEKIYQSLENRALSIDKSLQQPIAGEKQKAVNGLKNIEAKLLKALKNQSEQQIKSLRDARAKIYPDGIFQERRENLLHWNLAPEAFIHMLEAYANCLEPKVKIVVL